MTHVSATNSSVAFASESESTPSADRPRVVVAQLGARRHYLVPATYHSRGMLARFYTDLYAGGWAGRIAEQAARVFSVDSLRRVAGRQDQDLPHRLVTSFPAFACESRLRERRSKRLGELTRHWMWSGRRFSRLVANRSLDDCDAVYAYSSAALEIFEQARPLGKFCILDQATAPKRFEDSLTMQQADRYPGWSAAPPQDDRWTDAYADRQNREADLADLIICGSTFVKNAVEGETGAGHKCEVVPLGMRRLPTEPVAKTQNSGRPLRILFVGDEAIRKGIGDLDSAVREFGVERCEVRVAGNIDLSEHGREQVQGALTLLGSVPREAMDDQYRWADVCVLPSISDTFGLVILEALSFGVPVITTPNTGGADVISDGVNGYVVPIMAPEKIAARLELLNDDRELLASLSAAALQRSRDYSIDRYADRLVAVVCERFRQFRSPASDRFGQDC